MRLTINIFLAFSLFCSQLFAQDSAIVHIRADNLVSSSEQIPAEYLQTISSNNKIIRSPQLRLGAASQPIFVNSERPLIDGTLWRENLMLTI